MGPSAVAVKIALRDPNSRYHRLGRERLHGFWPCDADRYNVSAESDTLRHIVGALGYLDDLEQDDALPVGKDELAEWWTKRQARLVRHLSRNPL